MVTAELVGADMCHEVLELRILHCSEGPATGNNGNTQQIVEHEQLSWPDLRLVQTKSSDPFVVTHNSRLRR